MFLQYFGKGSIVVYCNLAAVEVMQKKVSLPAIPDRFMESTLCYSQSQRSNFIALNDLMAYHVNDNLPLVYQCLYGCYYLLKLQSD